MRRIIIDCDPGNGIPGANVDDGLALGLALASKKLCLELITIVAGNTPRDVGYQVAKELVSELGLAIPVVKGATKARMEPARAWRQHLDHRHRHYGNTAFWKNTPAFQLHRDNTPANAADILGKKVCDNPGEITVVATGPLTNIARAIELYPKFAQSVARISIMGGVFHSEEYLKDTNFGMDPEAAKMVLESGAPITLAPLDATTTTLLTLHDLDKLETMPNALTCYLTRTFRPWIRYSMKTRHIPGCWIHDAVSVALLIDPSIVTTAPYRVDIALEGAFTRGSSRRWKEDALRLTVGMPKDKHKAIDVVKTVNNKKLLSLIFSTMKYFPDKN